jgi:predicted HAD superfamily phosphohydrolase YqeG
MSLLNTRIRYRKTKTPGIERSVRRFISQVNQAIYEVEINLNDNTYRVINVRQQECVRSSDKDDMPPTISQHVLKRRVKQVLDDLGVDFDVEIRQPRPDRTSEALKARKQLTEELQ